MAYENQEIVNGANPSIIWTQYYDFLATYARQMKSEYTQRMRANNPFTWAELDVMNEELHHKLDVLMTWKEDVDDKIKFTMPKRKTEVPRNVSTDSRGNSVGAASNGHGADYIPESKKLVKKITESQLKNMVAESVKRILRESLEGQTAFYQGREYTIDDELPYNAKVSIRYPDSMYAYGAYPNKGESLRDWIESRGKSVNDIAEWWMN